MQRVLVVGGAGVVGSHLVDRLLAEGNEVIAVDDLSRGSFANVAHLKHDPRFVFVEHDVAQGFRAEVERIFHLALPSTRTACAADPVKAAITCVRGTINVLEAAAASGARVVACEATERWGDGVRCAESLAFDFAKARTVGVHFVRMPSVYGPRLSPDGEHVVTTMALQALRGENLAPRMRVDRRVRLTYVDDAVETLMRAMDARAPAPIILAPSSEVTVFDLAHLIAEAAGLVGITVSDGSLPGDTRSSEALSHRPALATALPAAMALGLTSSVELADGIDRTVRWFAAQVGLPLERTSGIYAQRATPRDIAPAEEPRSRRAG